MIEHPAIDAAPEKKNCEVASIKPKKICLVIRECGDGKGGDEDEKAIKNPLMQFMDTLLVDLMHTPKDCSNGV